MRTRVFITVAAIFVAAPAFAGSQSSNTSSNSSSNNGVVRERIVDSYCEDGDCVRRIERRVYRDGGQKWRGGPRYGETRERYWRDESRRYGDRRRGDDDD